MDLCQKNLKLSFRILLDTFLLRWGVRHILLCHSKYPFISIMDIPAEAVRQEKDIKSTQIGKEEVKLFADDVILYIENPKESIKTLLELINKFSTIAGYEIQKLLVFYTIVMNNPKIKLRKKKYKIYLI